MLRLQAMSNHLIQQTHVIVVGGGLAGLSAAIEAERKGAKVTLLEKTSSISGNSGKATSGINGIHTPAQLAYHVEDTLEAFKQDTLKSGAGLCVEPLVDVLVSQSKNAIEFLESFGISLSVISRLGGHSAARTHREAPKQDGKPAPVGWDIMTCLKNYFQKKCQEEPQRISIVPHATVIKLLSRSEPERHTDESLLGTANNQIVSIQGVVYHDGVKNQDISLEADAVVLATGGFASDRSDTSLLKEFTPEIANLATTNGPFAQGDGVKLGRAIQAKLIDMDKVQIHPTAFVDPSQPANAVKFLAPEALRGSGGILINTLGMRFVNELGLRDYVSSSIFADNAKRGVPRDKATALIVLNDAAVRLFGGPAFDFYHKAKGFFTRYENASALAAALNLAPDNAQRFASMLQSYGSVSTHQVDEFGKAVFPVLFSVNEPLYVATITPALHYTMGGLAINESAEVLLQSTSKPILRLFAAGEVTGGVHGNNRLAGNSLLECVVFGRIAGTRAASLTKDTSPSSLSPGINPSHWTPLRFRAREQIPGSNFCKVFKFDLPSQLQQTGLKVGEYISVRAICSPVDRTFAPSVQPSENLTPIPPTEAVRFYSPISRPTDFGHIDLLVKVDDKGCMSQFLNTLQPGDTLDFKGPMGGLHIDWKKCRKIGLIAGGVGISPMIQIIRHVLHEGITSVKLKLLWGVMEVGELVYRDKLESLAAAFPNLLEIHYVVNSPPPGWTQSVGFINASVLQKQMFPPAEDVFLVLCGPPAMCRALKPQFESVGFTKDMYFSFM